MELKNIKTVDELLKIYAAENIELDSDEMDTIEQLFIEQINFSNGPEVDSEVDDSVLDASVEMDGSIERSKSDWDLLMLKYGNILNFFKQSEHGKFLLDYLYDVFSEVFHKEFPGTDALNPVTVKVTNFQENENTINISFLFSSLYR
jgi:hypothetical protein